MMKRYGEDLDMHTQRHTIKVQSPRDVYTPKNCVLPAYQRKLRTMLECKRAYPFVMTSPSRRRVELKHATSLDRTGIQRALTAT